MHSECEQTTEPDSYLAGPKSRIVVTALHTPKCHRWRKHEWNGGRRRERASPLVWHEWISYCVLWILCLFILSLTMAAVYFAVAGAVEVAAPFPMPLSLLTSYHGVFIFEKVVFFSLILFLRLHVAQTKNTRNAYTQAYNRDGTTRVLTLPKHKRNSRIIDDIYKIQTTHYVVLSGHNQ